MSTTVPNIFSDVYRALYLRYGIYTILNRINSLVIIDSAGGWMYCIVSVVVWL
jgi:hypothetical protein